MDNVQFQCKISDGFVIKLLLSLLKTVSIEYNLSITDDSIAFYPTTVHESATTVAHLYSKELFGWINNFPTSVSFKFSTDELTNSISRVKRAETIMLMISDNMFYITIFSKSSYSTSRNVSFVKCEKYLYPFIFDELECYQNVKSIVEQSSQIINVCTSFIKMKCDHIDFVIDKSSLMFVGKIHGKTKSVYTFGSESDGLYVVPDSENEEGERIFEIKPEALKLLQVASKITKDSAVQFFFVRNNPLKITFHISTYGVVTIYLFGNLKCTD